MLYGTMYIEKSSTVVGESLLNHCYTIVNRWLYQILL